MSARELITEHLDLWTGAVTKKPSGGRGSNGKVELTGVKKLRELILDLALKGRLSQRFIDDQPAEKLIEQFFLHKEKLVKDGELRRQKKLPEITYQEHEYKIPETWQVERLARLSHQITKGTTPTSIGLSFAEKGVNFVKVESLHDGGINHANVQFISQDTHQALQRSQLEAGDILFSIAGTIGKTAIVQDKDTPANTNQALAIIKGTSQVFTESFLKLQLDSFVSAKAKNKARGGAMSNISLGDLSNLVVIVPPIEEQHRIVQKVDELMALCDRLEHQTSDQLEAHEILVDTLLGTLTQSENATELADNWARLTAHFDTLFTTEQSIDKLKQAILQLAVMGRLVEQDAGDEPAEVTLSRTSIRQDETPKAVLKKREKLGPPMDAEIPFTLPKGWKWARFIDISINYSVGLDKGKSKQGDNKQYRYFKMNNILNSGGYQLDDIVSVDATIDEVSRYSLSSGDFLFNTRNSKELVGKTCVYTHDGGAPVLYNNNVLKAKFSNTETAHFIDIWMRSSEGKRKLEEIKSGTTNVWAIYQGKLETLPCPFPPIEEQQRIVRKVHELTALCEQLKERLNQASETRNQLAEAVVEGALN